MDKLKPENFDYSLHQEHAEEYRKEFADTDRLIAEGQVYLEGLKQYKQLSLESTEYAKEHGLDDKSNITEIDQWISEAEQSIKELEQIKADYAKLVLEFERLHQKGKELLDKHDSDKTN